jgi:hypothetical protein
MLHDGVFAALVTVICGSVVAIIPRKFEECQKMEQPLRFDTRTEMLVACCQSIISSRSTDNFDEPDIQKWAVAYMVQVAYYYLGHDNRMSFWNAEAGQIARLRRFEDTAILPDLSCIEMQLRKKAVWLMLLLFV